MTQFDLSLGQIRLNKFYYMILTDFYFEDIERLLLSYTKASRTKELTYLKKFYESIKELRIEQATDAHVTPMFFIATCGADATNTTTNNDYISRKIKHIKTLLRESVKKDTQKEIFIKVTGSDTKYTFLLKRPLLKHIFEEMKTDVENTVNPIKTYDNTTSSLISDMPLNLSNDVYIDIINKNLDNIHIEKYINRFFNKATRKDLVDVGKSLQYKGPKSPSNEVYIQNLKNFIRNKASTYTKKTTLPKDVLENISKYSGWNGGKTRRRKPKRKTTRKVYYKN